MFQSAASLAQQIRDRQISSEELVRQHLQRIEQRGAQLLFNPGECAGHIDGLNAIGILDLDTLTPEVLTF